MTATERTRSLDTLLDRLKRAYGEQVESEPAEPTPPVPLWLSEDPVLRELLRSFLMWEAPASKSRAALESLESTFIDINDLRVSLTSEVAAALGRGYPRGLERAERLRAALNDIYRREHAVSLAHLAQRGRREARAYLEALAGVPPFVAARIQLFALEWHAMPVDDRLAARLIEASVVEPGQPVEAIAGVLERAVRAGDGPLTARVLQAWCDDPKPPSLRARTRATATAPRRSPARRPPPKSR
jgi:hypothetical protein